MSPAYSPEAIVVYRRTDWPKVTSYLYFHQEWQIKPQSYSSLKPFNLPVYRYMNQVLSLTFTRESHIRMFTKLMSCNLPQEIEGLK